jgi:hypothetical protein
MDLGQFISKNKDFVDAVGVTITLFGFIYSVSESLERRSLESKRDKLLIRIQGLLAVRQEVGESNVLWQLEASRAEFARVSQRLAKHSQGAARYGFFRQFLLLYRPPNTLAWIPHLLYWLDIIALCFYSATRWHERDSSTVLGLLFYVAIALLVRQWGLSELQRLSEEHNPSGWPNRFWSFAGYFYWFAGFMFLAGVIHAAYSRQIKGAVTLAGVCTIVLGCAVATPQNEGHQIDISPRPCPATNTHLGFVRWLELVQEDHP